jgi:MFS family permease
MLIMSSITTENKDTGLFRFLSPLALSNMLNPLNSTMLATAVLSIIVAFKQEPGASALLIIPLYFTSAIGQPLMGRLCDIFSPHKINLIGFVLILISGVVGVFAQSFTWLIVSRILLGLGSSAAYPSSITIIKRRYDALNMPVPGITLGIIATAGQVSLAFGPFVGGIILESFGWKGIFAINIPLVIIGMLLSIQKKGDVNLETKKSNKTGAQILKDLDIVGVLLFSGFLMLFLMALLYNDYLYIKLPGMVLLLYLFIKAELRHNSPFIDVRILSVNLFLNTTFLRQVGITFILYLILYGLPQWMEQSKGIAPSNVGLIMLPLSVMATAMSLLFSKSKRYILLLTVGILCVIVASTGVFLLKKESPIYVTIFITIIIGAALGLLTIANQATLYAEAQPEQIGVSFGLYRTVGYVGAILAGSSLKHEFKHGASDSGLHSLGFYSLLACITIVLFMLPLYFKKNDKALRVNALN